MFNEQRLIRQQSVPSNAPASTPEAPNDSAIERALQLQKADERMQALEQAIVTKQTTAERMTLIRELIDADQTEETIQLSHKLLDNERIEIHNAREALTNAPSQPSTQEIARQLTELQERSQQVVDTRRHVLEVQQSQVAEAKQEVEAEKNKPLLTRTGDLLEEMGTNDFTKEWSRPAKIAAVVGTGALAISAGYMLFNWLRGKKETASTEESTPSKASILTNKWVLGSLAIGAGILGFLGFKKYKEMTKHIKEAQDLAKIAEQKAKEAEERLRDAELQTPELPEENEQVDEEKEALSRTATVRAFMYEHKSQLGDMDEVSQDALRTLMFSTIKDLPPSEFLQKTNGDLNTLLNRDNTSEPNAAELDVFAALKMLIEDKDISKYETMNDFFTDTLMGSVTERIEQVTEGKSPTEIDLAEVADAAMAQEQSYDLIVEKPQVKSSLETLGLTKTEFLELIGQVFANNPTSINDSLENEKFTIALQAMREEVQSDEAIQLIAQLGHNKKNANELIETYLRTGESTNLTQKDTIELFVYLQLMKDEAGKLPNTPREGSATGTYLMQMKALDILSKSNPGQDTIKSVQAYLFNEVLLNSNSPDANLPPEVIEQIRNLTIKAIETILSKLLDLAQEPIEFVEEWYSDMWERHPEVTGGITLASVLAIVGAAGLEFKNILRGMYLKKRAKMNEGNMHRFGFFDTQNMEMAVRNAERHAELRRIMPRGMFDIMVVLRRTPVYSQMVTRRAIVIDNYLQQRSLANADIAIVTERLARNNSTRHMNTSVVEQLQRIAKLSEVRGAGSLGNQGFLENLQTWWNQERSTGKKLADFITGVDGIDWERTTAVQKIINDVKVNRLPTMEQCLAAGLTQETAEDIRSKLEAQGIGQTESSNTATETEQNSDTSNNTESNTNNAEDTDTDGNAGDSAPENTDGDSDGATAEANPTAPQNNGGSTVEMQTQIDNLQDRINSASQELMLQNTLSAETVTELEGMWQNQSLETLTQLQGSLMQAEETLSEQLLQADTQTDAGKLLVKKHTVTEILLKQVTAKEIELKSQKVQELQQALARRETENRTTNSESITNITAEIRRTQTRIEALQSSIDLTTDISLNSLQTSNPNVQSLNNFATESEGIGAGEAENTINDANNNANPDSNNNSNSRAGGRRG